MRIQSQLTNARTQNLYIRRMLNVADNVILFKNMPEYIDVDYVNRVLTRKGSIAFFYEDVIESVIALPFTNVGTLDMYSRPTRIEVYGRNGYKRILKSSDDFVIMYDNTERVSLLIDIMEIATRIALKKRITDINIIAQKTPRIVKAPANKINTIRALLENIDANNDAIIEYDKLSLEDITMVLAPAPYVADKIEDSIARDWAEFYQLVGVNSIAIEKKERLIQNEVEYNLGGTIPLRYSRFTPRERAVKLINKKWRLDIELEYNDKIPSTKPEVESNDTSNQSNLSFK